MVAALVRSAVGSSTTSSSTVAATLAGGAITAGNTLLAVVTLRGGTTVVTPSGWTYRGFAAVDTSVSGSILLERVATGGESLTLTVTKSGSHAAYLVFMEFSGAGAYLDFATATHTLSPADGSLSSPELAATDSNTLAIGAFVTDYTRYPYHGPPDLSFTTGGGYTIVAQSSFVYSPTTLEPALAVSYKATGAGLQAALATLNLQEHYGSWLALYGTGGVPEPPSDPPAVPHEDEPPQGVLLEIYVAGSGTARWGIAHWGVDVWSSAEWTDVTPEGVRIRASWGTDRAEDGILARVRADTWDVDFYDPDRLLDPGNPDATWAANLIPGLPIRFSHRGIVIRYGVVESIGYDQANDSGYMRVTNHISYMANATIPAGTSLPNTLYARARAVIAEADLSVTVGPDPATGDPAVAPEIADEASVWTHVTDAALQVLNIPYVDHDNVLRFRPYDTPLDRGRQIADPELVNLLAIRDASGLFSTIRALDDDGVTLTSRSATPTPKYGNKVYTARDNLATIASEAWCIAVLQDRVSSGLRWLPGTVRPLTANSVESFATIEQGELVALVNATITPAVFVSAIVLGVEVVITAKVNEEAIWNFSFATAETNGLDVVLADIDGVTFIASDQDPTQFVVAG